jgi:hypothetical protein
MTGTIIVGYDGSTVMAVLDHAMVPVVVVRDGDDRSP